LDSFSRQGLSAEEFKAIGEKLGPFDFSLLKISANGQASSDVHLTTEEVISVHCLVKAKVLVPAHWGTFKRAFHSWKETIDELQVTAHKSNVQLLVPKPGQSFEPGNLPAPEPWWRTLQ